MSESSRIFTPVFLAVLWVMALGLNCRGAESPPLPLCVADTAWRPLSQRWDKGLQARLDQALRRNKLWNSLIGKGKMAVGVVDLSDFKAPRYARVNGYTMMYAASLPKIAILLAAFRGFEDGTLKETPTIQADLVEMIRRSDNAAANRLIGRLGLGKIAAVLLDSRQRFYDAKQGGGIWVGSAYGSEAEQYPEPIQNLLHAATVHQVCRFYYLLAYGRLINPQRSRQMLKILAFPDLHDKFVRVLERAVPPQRLYRKSGGWKIWHSDSVLVWGETWRRYILVSLVEHEQGEQILRELVPVVETILKAEPHPGGNQADRAARP